MFQIHSPLFKLSIQVGDDLNYSRGQGHQVSIQMLGYLIFLSLLLCLVAVLIE